MTPKFSLLAVPCAALLVTFVACKPAPPATAPPATGPNPRAMTHAIRVYTTLVDRYPESEFAPQAQARLSVLKPSAAGAPAPKQ